MPHTHQPDQPTPPRSPVCPHCNRPMRLVAATPDTPFKNIKRATFECDCGRTGDAMLADKD
jgi:C4-type Zn-finger protein